MEARPKIKINLTGFEKRLETFGIILIIIMWIFALLNYFKSPEIVAIHFDLSGNPDGYGNKLINLLLPVIFTLLYLGLTQLNKYPHFFNYMTKITEENAERQYTLATRMIRILKLTIVLSITFDILFTFLITLGISNGLSMWLLPFEILIIAVPIIYLTYQSLNKNKNVL